MKGYKTFFQVVRIPVFVALICGGAFLSMSVYPSAQKISHPFLSNDIESVDDLKVINKTSFFRIIEMEKVSQGNLRLILKNDYDKRITAFQIAIDNTTALIDALYTDAEHSIPPGSIREHIEPLNIDPHMKEHYLSILAVVFDDGTSDGDSVAIKEINDYRLGSRMQMDHTLPLLNEIMNLPDDEISAALDNLPSSLLSASQVAEHQPLSLNTKLGMRNRAKMLAHQIKNIKNKDIEETKARLVKFLNYSRSKSEELTTYLETVKSKKP